MEKLLKLPQDGRITILALSWRDICSPVRGGAEVHTHDLLKCLDRNKYRIIHFAPYYLGEKEDETIDGIRYLRRGTIYSVILYAMLFYFNNRKSIDLVIEQCNTHRFFTPLWVNRKKRVFYIHQLTREIWDINMNFPFNKIGKVMENSMLRLNRRDYTIALSSSTKHDLMELGYIDERVSIIPVGMNFKPWDKGKCYEKERIPTFVYTGRYSFYKGIEVAVEALGILKQKGIKSRLWLLGEKNIEYINVKLKPLCEKYGLIWSDAGNSGNEENGDVVAWGFVAEEKKLELLSRSTALVFPSIREGWGIPITEAAFVGTPSIVFDSPGLRDAIDFGNAGYLCRQNNVSGMSQQMECVIGDQKLYEKMKEKAFDFSKQFQWENNKEKLEDFIAKCLGRR